MPVSQEECVFVCVSHVFLLIQWAWKVEFIILVMPVSACMFDIFKLIHVGLCGSFLSSNNE